MRPKFWRGVEVLCLAGFIRGQILWRIKYHAILLHGHWKLMILKEKTSKRNFFEMFEMGLFTILRYRPLNCKENFKDAMTVQKKAVEAKASGAKHDFILKK